MNETNPTHFLLQRYLENISASRTAMNSLFYSMLNSISEQERNMSELLYHYISSTQTQNNNIALDIQNQQSTNHMNVARQNTPTFSDTSGYFINPNRVSTRDDTVQQNTFRRRNVNRHSSLYNRMRNRTRGNTENTFVSRTRPNTSDNVWNAILNFANQPNLTSDILRPVVVRPTLQQIQRATENVVFSSIENPRNHSCPISQERFIHDANVTRIVNCGHIFYPEQIREWFRRNVRCPVCRFDIRNHVYREQSASDSSNSEVDIDTSINSSINSSTSSNNITENTNNTDNTNNTENITTNENSSNNIDNVQQTNSTTIIDTPSSLEELAQSISTELANALQTISPNNVGDIRIEYGVVTDPQQVQNNNLQSLYHETDISNNDYYGVD